MYYSECGGLFMRRYRKSLWEKALRSIIVSAAAGFAVTMTCTAAFSVFILFFMDNMDSPGFFSSFSMVKFYSFFQLNFLKRENVFVKNKISTRPLSP